jgi:hypothetical protein
MANTNKIIPISFIAGYYSTWIHPILQKMNTEQKEKYASTFLPEIARSICRKLSILGILADDIGKEIKDINRQMILDKPNIDLVLRRENAAYSPKNIGQVYRTLGYIETFLTNMESVTDFMISFYTQFNRAILSRKIGNRGSVIRELQNHHIALKWKDELSAIRNDIIHNYTSWLAFKRVNDHYRFVLLTPKKSNRIMQHKNYQKTYLDLTKISGMYVRTHNLISKTSDLIIKKMA